MDPSRNSKASSTKNSLAPDTLLFPVKGMVYCSTKEYIAQHVPGGVSAVASALSPRFRTFFEDAFVPVSWYDITPLGAITACAATLAGIREHEYVRKQAAWLAARDMNGVYKSLLRAPSPEAVCKRYASIYSQMYGFGQVSILSSAPGRVESSGSGMPLVFAQWWTRACDAYVAPILIAAGANSPRISWQSPQADGEKHGVPLVSVRGTTTWK